MTEHHYSLVPFPDPAPPGIIISGRIEREHEKLAVYYSLTGNREEILIPVSASRPGRRDQLWTETCFEFFLAIRDQPQYWEFNLSPSGNWNAYRMDAYRRVGFREEMSIEQLQVEVLKNGDCISAAVSVELSQIIPAGEIIQVGVASVIQTRSGQETYWALAHPAPYPDFHLKNSFLLQL